MSERFFEIIFKSYRNFRKTIYGIFYFIQFYIIFILFQSIKFYRNVISHVLYPLRGEWRHGEPLPHLRNNSYFLKGCFVNRSRYYHLLLNMSERFFEIIFKSYRNFRKTIYGIFYFIQFYIIFILFQSIKFYRNVISHVLYPLRGEWRHGEPLPHLRNNSYFLKGCFVNRSRYYHLLLNIILLSFDTISCKSVLISYLIKTTSFSNHGANFCQQISLFNRYTWQNWSLQPELIDRLCSNASRAFCYVFTLHTITM